MATDRKGNRVYVERVHVSHEGPHKAEARVDPNRTPHAGTHLFARHTLLHYSTD